MFINEEITQMSVIPNTDDVLVDEEVGYKKYAKYFIEIKTVNDEVQVNFYKYELSTHRNFKISMNYVYMIENNKLIRFDLNNIKEVKKFTHNGSGIEFKNLNETNGILEYELVDKYDYLIILNGIDRDKILSVYTASSLTKLSEVKLDNLGDYTRFFTNGEIVIVNDVWRGKANKYLIIEPNNDNYEKQLKLLNEM